MRERDKVQHQNEGAHSADPMIYPLKFQPIFKQRIWGGRGLERLFHKALPPSLPIGESWELVDRSTDNSVIANGRYSGKTLRWLLELHGDKILGASSTQQHITPFPLLIKWLDARELLSVQVHPPPHVANQFGSEPKTEMWWIADTAPNAEIVFGLKRDVTREKFVRAVADGTVADCLHRVVPKRGDIFFIPSGRVHALGEGVVLLEIQQNSDTTYRVFDWNRKDANGKPRDLHVEQALASIDFTDYEPAPLSAPHVSCPHFTASAFTLTSMDADRCDGSSFQILCQLRGSSLIASRMPPPHESFQEILTAGELALLPAALGDYRIEPLGQQCELMKVISS